MAFVRKIGFLRGSTRDICLTDSNLPAADLTTDTDFTQSIGRKADATATAVGTTASLFGMIKYVANLLNGTRVRAGQLLTLVAAGKRATAAGTSILTATGTIFVARVHLKKITGAETNIQTISLTSNDTVGLNLLLRKDDGSPIVAADFGLNVSRVFDVGWQLATTKIMKLVSDVDGNASGYQIHLETYAVTENASIA